MQIKNFLPIILFFLIVMSCSSTKDQITDGIRYDLYKDSLLRKHYYVYDSMRLYVIIPEEIEDKNPKYLFEDSKGTPFISIGEDLFEVDIDTTNSLYTGAALMAITDSLKTKELANKKLSKAKSKKKSTAKPKKGSAPKKKK